MITRVQDKALTREIRLMAGPKLSALEKAMLRWIVVDPEDKVLDASVDAGLMAEYLRRNMQCEVCGVSDDMESVRRARTRLQSCDIVYAAPGDIPWHDESFDTVLMKLTGDEETLPRLLKEAQRVLKTGGQLILGAPCMPAAMSAVADWIGEESSRRMLHRSALEKSLSELAFENVSWQRTNLRGGVMIAWKRKADVETIRRA